MPIYTFRAIIQKFKANKLAWKRLHVYFAVTHSEEDDKRGKKFPKEFDGELQRKVAYWGHQVSKTTIRHDLYAIK